MSIIILIFIPIAIILPTLYIVIWIFFRYLDNKKTGIYYEKNTAKKN